VCDWQVAGAQTQTSGLHLHRVAVEVGWGTTFGNTMMVPVPWLAALQCPPSPDPPVCASRENANKSLPGQPARPAAVHAAKNKAPRWRN